MSFDEAQYKKSIEELVAQFNYHLAEVDRLREVILDVSRLKDNTCVKATRGTKVRYTGSDEEWQNKILFVEDVWLNQDDHFDFLYPIYSQIEITWAEEPLSLVYLLVPPTKAGTQPKYPRITIHATEDDFELIE